MPRPSSLPGTHEMAKVPLLKATDSVSHGIPPQMLNEGLIPSWGYNWTMILAGSTPGGELLC